MERQNTFGADEIHRNPHHAAGVVPEKKGKETMSKAQIRRYIVRAIEDAIMFAALGLCIVEGCAAFSALFRALGI